MSGPEVPERTWKSMRYIENLLGISHEILFGSQTAAITKCAWCTSPLKQGIAEHWFLVLEYVKSYIR